MGYLLSTEKQKLVHEFLDEHEKEEAFLIVEVGVGNEDIVLCVDNFASGDDDAFLTVYSKTVEEDLANDLLSFLVSIKDSQTGAGIQRGHLEYI